MKSILGFGGGRAPGSDFVAIDRDWFWSMAAHRTKKITL